MTFTLANGPGTVPAGASITSGGAFTWTPTAAQVGTHTFDVCVSDGELSDCETIDVVVSAANAAPVLDPVGDKTATAGTELAFTATATDPDAGDTLTFTLAGTVPAGASITSGGAFTWTPTAAQVGPHTFDVCVSDGELSDCETIDVVVSAANAAPVLDPVGDKTATAGTELAFTATATDPDAGDTLTFTLAGTVPAGASITSGGAFTWTPTTAQVGTAHLRRVRLRRRGSPTARRSTWSSPRPTPPPSSTRWATRPPPPAPSSPSRRPLRIPTRATP